MLRADVQEWPRGRCEAGLPIVGVRGAAFLPPCEKRGRWLVGGVVLCGGCRKALGVAPYLTRGQRNAHHRGLA